MSGNRGTQPEDPTPPIAQTGPTPERDPDRYDPSRDSANQPADVTFGELLTATRVEPRPAAALRRPRPRPSRPERSGPSTGARLESLLPKTVRGSLDAIGGLYSMAGASMYGLGADLARGRFKFAEFTDRAWFLVNVTLLPAVLVSTPLGVAIALQVGALAAQIGATNFVGAANAIGILREASPIVTALLLAGVGGSAVCAELGSRAIREEIDAMIVLGLNPLRRLVAPLMVAGVLVSAFLNFVVIFVSVLSAYLFDIGVLHGTKGSFFGSFVQFATIPDFITSEVKACVFGLTAVLIAAYKGLNAKRGPTGVGEAVNQSVVITGIVLFAFNLVITEIFFALVPQRTF